MKKILTIILPLVILIGVYSGCDHQTDVFDGPNLIDRFGPFNVQDSLQLNRAAVDFSSGETVIFAARFNKNVNWVVVITGQESGAVKRIEGFEKELSTENAKWTGGTTDLPFFKTEICTVELIIPEEDSLTMTGQVEVTGLKIYGGSLIADFETDAGADIEFGNYEFELTAETGRQDDIPAAQGDWYYLFRGTDNVVPNFFTGLINIFSSITGETYFPVPTTIPENLYFNVFMKSFESPHTIAVIQFAYDSNNSGSYEDGQDATFQIDGDFPVNWKGWRHISHPMSDLGMTEAQVSKIVAVRVLLISDMNSQPNPPNQVDFGVDYMTFTENGPLEL